MLVPDEQSVTKAGCGNEARSPSFAFDQSVGDQRGGVHDWCGDVARENPCFGKQLGDSGAHSVKRRRRRGECLVDDHTARRSIK